MLIYIAGKYSGKTLESIKKNIKTASEYARKIAEMGHTPICPHTLFLPLTGMDEREVMIHCLEMVRLSDAILMLPDWKRSRGATKEYQEARLLGLKIFFRLKEVR